MIFQDHSKSLPLYKIFKNYGEDWRWNYIFVSNGFCYYKNGKLKDWEKLEDLLLHVLITME